MTAPLVIIGSGLAAYSVARDWRRLDGETPLVIITAEDGDFYSKPLLSTSLAKSKSLDELVIASGDQQGEQFNAKLLAHTCVTRIDPDSKTVFYDGGEQHYSQLVLAQGGQAIRAPLAGDAVDAVISMNSLMDYRQLQPQLKGCNRVAVLGAGLVGMELANDMQAIGIQVTVIDPCDQPLKALLPSELGAVVEGVFRDASVDLRLGCVAKAIDHSGDGYRVTLSTDACLEVDLVISAIGIRPEVALAQSAGIQVEHGIVVDEYCETSVEGIFALGDCAEVMGQWRPHIMPIMHCSRTVAQVLSGNKVPLHYPVMPVVVKTPLCPIASVLPPINKQGEWKVDGEGKHLRALFLDDNGATCGFILLGDRIEERADCIKLLNL